MLLPEQELVVVLDFGGQNSHLIARHIRELKVFCEILPFSTPVEEITAKKPLGIIFSGGPAGVYQENAPVCDPAIYEQGIPILGIGYGMRLMARQLGGRVSKAGQQERGGTELYVLGKTAPFTKLNLIAQCTMSCGDTVESAPPGFMVVARTEKTPVAAMANPAKNLYAVLFRPDAAHAPGGQDLLKSFLYDVCGCHGFWTMRAFLERAVAEIREQVGDKQLLCGLSGGVDSSVAAALAQRAVGDRLTSVFVNHGLLRKGEARQVMDTFKGKLGMNLIYVDASERFLTKLAGVSDPEQKRKIIGEEFIRVFEDQAARLGQVDFLLQGTLYPDVAESGTAAAPVIKSHHNVGGLPGDMQFELVEPLRRLFKDEVRVLGEELGLPEEVVWRQPFPGPGLAVRIIGEVTAGKVTLLQEADAIVEQEIRAAGLNRQIWQSFAVLTGMRSVGMSDNKRTYARTIAIRAVRSTDAMTADWVRLPYETLEAISSRIVSEVKGVNRVVYDITPKPPSTIEWE